MNRRGISRPTSVSTLLNSAVIFVLVGMMLQAEAILLAPVYWNASNPTFKLSRNSLTIEVNLYDGIDFVCPFYNATDTVSNSSSDLEYYVIYLVSKQSYDTCSLLSHTTAILNCSTPRQLRRFTMFFEPFQAIPNAPEFHAGHSYYFITTSTGRKDGLMNADRGACYHHNMKLVISVCCRSSKQSTSTVPTSTTSTLSSSLLSSRSSTITDHGVGNSRALDTSSTHVRTSTAAASMVVIHVDPSTSRQRDETFSERSTASRITTSTSRHPSEREQLQSLSCTHYTSDFIFYISLLQALAFHYLLS